MTENENIPEHWGDLSLAERKALQDFARLTPDERKEVLGAARSRLFWRQLFARLEWLKGVVTVLLTLLAAWTVFGEALAEWLSEKK